MRVSRPNIILVHCTLKWCIFPESLEASDNTERVALIPPPRSPSLNAYPVKMRASPEASDGTSLDGRSEKEKTAGDLNKQSRMWLSNKQTENDQQSEAGKKKNTCHKKTDGEKVVLMSSKWVGCGTWVKQLSWKKWMIKLKFNEWKYYFCATTVSVVFSVISGLTGSILLVPWEYRIKGGKQETTQQFLDLLLVLLLLSTVVGIVLKVLRFYQMIKMSLAADWLDDKYNLSWWSFGDWKRQELA